MKKMGLLLSLALIACTTTGMSQQPASPTTEYWVVESHTRDTIYSVVRFYDGGNSLLHEVRIENIAIDIQQKKQRKKLDHLLAEFRKVRWGRGQRAQGACGATAGAQGRRGYF